jgi:hypothetical protein
MPTTTAASAAATGASASPSSVGTPCSESIPAVYAPIA